MVPPTIDSVKPALAPSGLNPRLALKELLGLLVTPVPPNTEKFAAVPKFTVAGDAAFAGVGTDKDPAVKRRSAVIPAKVLFFSSLNTSTT
jgi:hypothetical protein